MGKHDQAWQEVWTGGQDVSLILFLNSLSMNTPFLPLANNKAQRSHGPLLVSPRLSWDPKKMSCLGCVHQEYLQLIYNIFSF